MNITPELDLWRMKEKQSTPDGGIFADPADCLPLARVF
tara:strand:- start:1008 stop:1121 length:114 start_codon:yes stop_codon:yes gene_type:complete